MRYVFGFDLEYQKYKKHLRIKLFFDDRMIDDITLYEDSRFAKFYELELDQCREIKFEIDCEDSNYTNGFITKTARYKLHETLFIPKDCFNEKHHQRLRDKKRQKQKNLYGHLPEWNTIQEDIGVKHLPHGGPPTWPLMRWFRTYHAHKKIEITTADLFVNESAIIKIPVKRKFNTLLQDAEASYMHFQSFTPWLNRFNEDK